MSKNTKETLEDAKEQVNCNQLSSEKNLKGLVHPIYQHTKFSEIMSLGEKDSILAQSTFMVYIDLVESKGWWNVNLKWCPSLQRVLICGHPTRTQREEAVLTISSHMNLSMFNFNKFIEGAKVVTGCDSLTLGILDPESNIVYYKISNTIEPPEPPEMIDAKKRRRKRKLERRKFHFMNRKEAMLVAKEAKSALGLTARGVDVQETNTKHSSASPSDAEPNVKPSTSSALPDGQENSSLVTGQVEFVEEGMHERYMLPEDCEYYSDESDTYADEL